MPRDLPQLKPEQGFILSRRNWIRPSACFRDTSFASRGLLFYDKIQSRSMIAFSDQLTQRRLMKPASKLRNEI